MKQRNSWHTDRLDTTVSLVRWGTWGRPVLLFPTAGGDAEEVERMGLIAALWPLINQGRIKVFSTDSVAGQVWTDGHTSGTHRAWLQNRYDAFVYQEVVPAIRADCQLPSVGVVTAGASIGAFNALAALCRHPDAFLSAICMSGTYDLSRWMGGEHTLDFHYSSPLHFLPSMDEGDHLNLLRRRSVVLASGEGRWEDPSESWQVAHALGSRGIPNRVDLWGPAWDHDWPTWREMLPRYLGDLSGQAAVSP